MSKTLGLGRDTKTVQVRSEGEVEGVESAECREVRGRESRLGHVEVFRMDCVRTSIIGRPRRLSRQRRAVFWNHRSTLSITKSRYSSAVLGNVETRDLTGAYKTDKQ